MTLLAATDGPPAYAAAALELGKQAADREVAYNLAGTLYLAPSGYVLLSVPNALARGVFAAMHEPGAELPPGPDGRFAAHVTVLTPDEVAQLGGPDRVTERGKQFRYTLGRLVAFAPDGWPGVARVWALVVHSDELQALRRSYGLSGLPRGGGGYFHVTVAVLRRGVLGRTETAKGPAGD